MAAGDSGARLQFSLRYQRAVEKLRGAVPRSKLDKAARLFIEHPLAHSLKFQEVAGSAGIFKYRVDRRWHVVMVKRDDEQGTYYEAVDIAHHDDY